MEEEMNTELKPAESQSLPFSVHMIGCDCGSVQAKLNAIE